MDSKIDAGLKPTAEKHSLSDQICAKITEDCYDEPITAGPNSGVNDGFNYVRQLSNHDIVTAYYAAFESQASNLESMTIVVLDELEKRRCKTSVSIASSDAAERISGASLRELLSMLINDIKSGDRERILEHKKANFIGFPQR